MASYQHSFNSRFNDSPQQLLVILMAGLQVDPLNLAATRIPAALNDRAGYGISAFAWTK